MGKKPQDILKDKKELAKVSKNLFNSTDKDKNGEISYSELEALMRKLAHEYDMDPPSSSDIDDCWTKLDKNHDNKISRDEFEVFVVQLLEALC